MSAQFAGLVIQQTNLALMLLGKSPHPETQKTMLDLEGAKMFIDQLEMLEVKTQGNLKPDWSEPAHEFPMFAQEAGLSAYARAWTMFGDPTYRQAADRIYGFLKNTMAAPGGGFEGGLRRPRRPPCRARRGPLRTGPRRS
jgi:hypothetical protein